MGEANSSPAAGRQRVAKTSSNRFTFRGSFRSGSQYLSPVSLFLLTPIFFAQNALHPQDFDRPRPDFLVRGGAGDASQRRGQDQRSGCANPRPSSSRKRNAARKDSAWRRRLCDECRPCHWSRNCKCHVSLWIWRGRRQTQCFSCAAPCPGRRHEKIFRVDFFLTLCRPRHR